MPDRNSPTSDLEAPVEAFYKDFPYPTATDFAVAFTNEFDEHCARTLKKVPPTDLSAEIAGAVAQIYSYEAPSPKFERKAFTDPVEHGRYRDWLLGFLQFIPKDHAWRLRDFKALLTEVFEPLVAPLPPEVCLTADHEAPATEPVPLLHLYPDAKTVVHAALEPLTRAFEMDEFFKDGRMGALTGRAIASNIKEHKLPTAGTPLSAVLECRVPGPPEEEHDAEPAPQPPELPLSIRFLGQWVIGTQGTGKTQLFQFMLSRDLDMVAQGKASLVVLDPTGDKKGRLIHNLITLQRFAPGGDLYGRLVYIDPSDRSHTLPINLLSLRADFDDEDAISSAISSYLSIMGGLMGQPLTSFQEPVFRFAVQAALAFPNPTLSTLREIIRPKSKAYEQVLDKVHPEVRDYFRDMFDADGPTRSRAEILNRLYTLSSDPKFRRLFNASETKIDFFEEINRPKVIVVNASRDYLQSLTELYGRYFLALITQAAERRASMPLGAPIPCFVYIDECDEFVANDPNAAKILLKLRGMRVGLILGNQLVSRITEPSVQESFLGTAIKFVNANMASARVLAEEMNCIGENGRLDPSFLTARPPLNFAFHVRGHMPRPIAVQVPYGVLESQPRMAEAEFARVRAEIRKRYYIPASANPAAGPGATPGGPADDLTQLLAGAYHALAAATQRGDWTAVAELKRNISTLEERLGASQAADSPLAHEKETPKTAPQAPESAASGNPLTEGSTDWR